MGEVAGWVSPFEEFFEQTGLSQCLRTLQIEAIVFPVQPRPDFNECLRRLSGDIQAYLAQHGGSAPVHMAAEDAAADEAEPADDTGETTQGALCGNTRGSYAQSVVQNSLDGEQTAQTMDRFVDRQQEGICRSNRDEFLVAGGGGDDTCARTDARGARCGVKLQADLGRDSTSALGRSTAARLSTGGDAGPPGSSPLDGLGERVENIREHLNVRFIPEAADIYRRVAALEDRIMLLEREFPPWSAEHFKQPGRRYAHPPPVTVYRVLPSAPAVAHGASVSVSATATASGSSAAAARPASARQQQYHHQPKLPSAASPHQPAPKRKRTGGQVESPLDATGKPIFHSCGRGVNSSLTRSVLA
ncbi:hypothetical protein LPJ61_000658, partial [Coemansia biformis]